jgi:hypothetical protein
MHGRLKITKINFIFMIISEMLITIKDILMNLNIIIKDLLKESYKKINQPLKNYQ